MLDAFHRPGHFAVQLGQAWSTVDGAKPATHYVRDLALGLR